MWGLAPLIRTSVAASSRGATHWLQFRGLASDAAAAAASSALPDPSKPLHLFVCAADEETDDAIARVVAALKQQHPAGVTLHGLGGPALQQEQLQRVNEEGWFKETHLMEHVEKVPNFVAWKIHKLDEVAVPTAHSYTMRQSLVVAAALRGTGSGGPLLQAQQLRQMVGGEGAGAAAEGEEVTPHEQQQQQEQQEQRQQPEAAAAAGAGRQQQEQQQQQQQQQRQQQAPYDAIFVGGGRRFAQHLLRGLRVAQEEYDAAGVPPRILYLPRDLADPRTSASAAKQWGRLADHVMCATAQEASLVEGAPASAVGHPLGELVGSAQQQRQRARSRGGGGKDEPDGGASGGGGGGGGGFVGGGAAGMGMDKVAWLRARAAEAAELAKGSGASSAFVQGSAERFWQRVGGGGAGGGGAGGGGAGGGGGERGPAGGGGRPLVALLPGCYESHLSANLGIFGAGPAGRRGGAGWDLRGARHRAPGK
ncbi:hypothetical protein MNEG_11537 [Monoraphidium neglectum]|uniref:Lipid-A-disaccharide synthase n=1 Tax=Monoraphidium neglectum TaxID=145388 RepID=A0A0D2MNZ1_9CHLO|nr:hypothetical protein MNEG_11537 [Monoraphidium neglectum]KIY96425.1 hypothetical protein MNEG_11537 [Monoraphidium neglectum]|eukprot:XP_013895445.1 hypothetical protein MNEG_11537 [Monoraphidium neglectum]